SGSVASKARMQRTRPARRRRARAVSQRQPSWIAAAGRIERLLDAQHERAVRERAAEAVVARLATGFAEQPSTVRVGNGSAARQRVGLVGRDMYGTDAELGAPAHAPVQRDADFTHARGGNGDAAAMRSVRQLGSVLDWRETARLRLHVGLDALEE